MINSSLIFTSLAQAREGLLWADRRQTLLTGYQKLWRNDARGTTADPVPVKFNWYRRVTEFWQDALWGRKPPEVSDALAMAFEEAAKWRSMKGNGLVVIEQDGTPRALDPQQWYPVYNPVDRDEVTGHIIAFFYRNDPAPDQAEQNIPDRVDFLLLNGEYGEGGGVRNTHVVDGQTVGRRIATREAAVRNVLHWGGGYSDYVDLQDVVGAFEKRYARVDRVLDAHSDPHLQGPVQALDAQGNFPTASDGNSMFLPLQDRESAMYAYLTFDGKLDPQRSMMDVLLDAIHVTTSIPATAFGLQDQAAGASGISRERQLFAALQKLRRLRREVTPMLLMAQGVDEITWADAPFSNHLELIEALGQASERGIYTPAEVRDLAGQ